MHYPNKRVRAESTLRKVTLNQLNGTSSCILTFADNTDVVAATYPVPVNSASSEVDQWLIGNEYVLVIRLSSQTLMEVHVICMCFGTLTCVTPSPPLNRIQLGSHL